MGKRKVDLRLINIKGVPCNCDPNRHPGISHEYEYTFKSKDYIDANSRLTATFEVDDEPEHSRFLWKLTKEEIESLSKLQILGCSDREEDIPKKEKRKFKVGGLYPRIRNYKTEIVTFDYEDDIHYVFRSTEWGVVLVRKDKDVDKVIGKRIKFK